MTKSTAEIELELERVRALLMGGARSDILTGAGVALIWCLGLGAAPSEVDAVLASKTPRP